MVGNGFVGIGWDEMGDLTDIGSDKEELKKRVAEAFPEAEPGVFRSGRASCFASDSRSRRGT